jgi:hypothetical protein
MVAGMGGDFDPLAGYFTQIPLDANAPLIPYGDLTASNAYGRPLILPDDIIPTMGLVTLVGSKNGAKLATGQHVDGSQDVYVVNQSAGGGLGPWKATESGGDAGLGVFSGTTQTGGTIGFAGPNPIRYLSLCFIPNPSGAAPGAGAFCEWEIGLQDPGHGISLILHHGLFFNTHWTATPAPVAQLTMPNTYIDWQGIGMRPSHAEFYYSSSAGDCQASATYIMGA